MRVNDDGMEVPDDVTIEVPVDAPVPLKLFVKPLERLECVKKVVLPESRAGGCLTLILHYIPDKACQELIDTTVEKRIAEYLNALGPRLAQLLRAS